MDEPQPLGRRRTPPPSVQTALSADDAPDQPVVVLDFLDRAEADALAGSFESRGWVALGGDDAFDALDLASIMELKPRLLLTDDPSRARSLPTDWGDEKPVTIVIVDDRESAVYGAYSAGADWVITRPFDPAELFRVQ